MTGFVIPDDWDGVTYKSYCVQWPDSVKWGSLLRGALSGFSFPFVWDGDTGNPDDAAQTGVEIITKNTSGGAFPVVCRPKAMIWRQWGSVQNVPSGVWTACQLDVTLAQFGPSGYIQPTPADGNQFRIRPQLAGYYHIEAGVLYNSGGSGRRMIRLVDQNAEIYAASAFPAHATGGTSAYVSAVLDSRTVSYLDLQTFQDSGTTLSIFTGGFAWLRVAYLGGL